MSRYLQAWRLCGKPNGLYCGAEITARIGTKLFCADCGDEAEKSVEKFEEARITSQASLLDLLANDIDFAFALIDIAHNTKDRDKTRVRIEKARATLNTIRKFSGRIEDPEEWKRIHARSDELEEAIRAVAA